MTQKYPSTPALRVDEANLGIRTSKLKPCPPPPGTQLDEASSPLSGHPRPSLLRENYHHCSQPSFTSPISTLSLHFPFKKTRQQKTFPTTCASTIVPLTPLRAVFRALSRAALPLKALFPGLIIRGTVAAMGKRKHRKAFPPKAPSSSSNAHEAPSPPPLPVAKFGEFKLTSISGPFTSNPVTTTTTGTAANSMGGEVGEDDGEGDWQIAKRHRKSKHKYPSLEVSPIRLKSAVKLSDIQSLALWLLADGTAPQWLLVKNKHEIRGVVVVMVPGLEMAMFNGDLDLTSDITTVGGEWNGEGEDLGVVVRNDLTKSPQPAQSPGPHSKLGFGWGKHAFYPQELKRAQLQACVKGFADLFSHVWPVKAPGDERGRVYSAITGFLNTPIPKEKALQETDKYMSRRIGITRLVMPFEELIENEYPIHSLHATASLLAEATKVGWVETDLSRGNSQKNNEGGSVTEAKTVYAMDCEMVQTKQGLELARISLVGWDGETVYNTLVKPDNPVTDYLTP